MDVDLEEIIAILEMLERSEVTDFRLDRGDLHLAIRRAGGELEGDAAEATAQATGQRNGVVAPPVSPAEPLRVVARPEPEPAARPPAVGEVTVDAPTLGVFYGAPKPGEPPFVKVGDTVTADSEVCVLEVMKLFNSVRAGITGEITGVLVRDGDMVEHGQALFTVRVAS